MKSGGILPWENDGLRITKKIARKYFDENLFPYREEFVDESYEIYLKCVLKYDIERNVKFSTYFYKAACNYAIRFRGRIIRDMKRNGIRFSDMKKEPKDPNVIISKELFVPTYEQELEIQIGKVIETLPLRKRELIKLYYFDGKSLRDIAEEKGVSREAVRCLLVRTLVKIKEAVNARKVL